MLEINSQFKLKIPSNRSFGITFVVVFVLIGIFPFVSEVARQLLQSSDIQSIFPVVSGAVTSLRLWALGVAGIFSLLLLLAPSLLTYPNMVWARFGDIFHKITSPIALGLVFVIAFVPMGLLLRLLRKDPLRLRKDTKLKSYWISRPYSGSDTSKMTNQF